MTSMHVCYTIGITSYTTLHRTVLVIVGTSELAMYFRLDKHSSRITCKKTVIVCTFGEKFANFNALYNYCGRTEQLRL